MKWTNPSKKQIIEELKVLVDDGENLEYTRGALEIVASFLNGNDENFCHADKSCELGRQIGLSEDVIKQLY